MDIDKPLHIHCQECFHEIFEGEETHTGQQVVWIGTSEGLKPAPRPVPICQTCWQKIKADHIEQAVPKLIVPKFNGG